MGNQNDFGQRRSFQGNWTCSGCGEAITELPFEPDGSKPIFCRNCYKKQRDERGGSTGGRQQRNSFGAPRPMHQGNWTCSGCGEAITELPFEPDGSRPIFCRNCHREKRGNDRRF